MALQLSRRCGLRQPPLVASAQMSGRLWTASYLFRLLLLLTLTTAVLSLCERGEWDQENSCQMFLFQYFTKLKIIPDIFYCLLPEISGVATFPSILLVKQQQLFNKL